jgi:hypothetical protein
MAGEPGTQTGEGVTTYSFFTNRSSGYLTNILNGQQLPVVVSLISSGDVRQGSTAGLPLPGTPLYNTFNLYVWFDNSRPGEPAASIQVTPGANISYVFSGLNPSKRYIFRGGAVRGDPTFTTDPWFTNRWTLVELAYARSYVANHQQGADSPWGILTSQIPGVSLQTNQAAVLFGDNRCGDMIEWDYIDPGLDGSFTVTCAYYGGPVPSGYGTCPTRGDTSGPYGYGIGGFCLEEVCLGIGSQPRPQVAYCGSNVTLNVTVLGQEPIFYEWRKNGAGIEGGTNSSLTLTNLQLGDAGSYSVAASNWCGYTISSNAYLTVSQPLVNASIALYAGVTINGEVGNTFGIKYSKNVADTNSWLNLTNVTLTQPLQLWIDPVPALHPQRFYSVVPGPITVP